MLKIRPLRNMVVCSFDAQTPSGIIEVIDKRPSNRATVLAVGPGLTLPNGSIKPMQVSPGDKVLLARYGGFSYECNGVTVRLLPEDEILAVLNV